MITDAIELEFWYRLFNSTFHQERGPKGTTFSVWHEYENIFREACAYHISRLGFYNSKVRYILRGVEYLPGEKAPASFLS